MTGSSLNKHPIKVLLFCVVVFLLWCVAGWNSDNYDYYNYSLRYSVVQNHGFDILKLDFGYDYIQSLFIRIGLDYQEFRIAVYGIGLLILSRLIYRWSTMPFFVLFFYICFHYIRDVVQTRNFIGSLFVLSTIDFYGKSTVRSKIYLIILLFSAFSVHMSFILYIPLFFVDYKKWNYWAFFFSCILLSIFANSFLSQFTFLNSFDGMSDKVGRFLSDTPQYALISAIGLSLGNGICVTYFYKYLKRYNLLSGKVCHLMISEYAQIIYNINALSNVLMIFTVISGSFYSRLFGNILILNVIFFTNVITLAKVKKLGLYACLLIYIIVYLYFMQITPFNEHFNLVINNNLLI